MTLVFSIALALFSLSCFSQVQWDTLEVNGDSRKIRMQYFENGVLRISQVFTLQRVEVQEYKLPRLRLFQYCSEVDSIVNISDLHYYSSDAKEITEQEYYQLSFRGRRGVGDYIIYIDGVKIRGNRNKKRIRCHEKS